MNRYFPPRFADLYPTVEELNANPLDTWVVVKDAEVNRRFPWSLRDQHGTEHDRFPTKREAMESLLPGGFYNQRYFTEQAWFAGTAPDGWKSHATVQAERAEREQAETRRLAQQQRCITRQGITVSEHAEWAKALDGDDPAALRRAAARMFEVLSAGNLVDPTHLDESEASYLFRDFSEQYGFSSPVSDWLHRVKYLGLDTDKTAVEILELMDQAELEARQAELSFTF